MSIGDAIVHAECDKCGEVSDPITLTSLAQQGSWDERNVAGILKSMNWEVADKQTFCPDCAEERVAASR